MTNQSQNQKRKVFVPNKGGHDYSAAERFGQLIFVTEGYIDRWHVTHMYRAWAKVLEESGPDDYILETSLNTLCSVGAACFAYKHQRLNLLLFKDGDYQERSLLISELISLKGEQDNDERGVSNQAL